MAHFERQHRRRAVVLAVAVFRETGDPVVERARVGGLQRRRVRCGPVREPRDVPPVVRGLLNLEVFRLDRIFTPRGFRIPRRREEIPHLLLVHLAEGGVHRELHGLTAAALGLVLGQEESDLRSLVVEALEQGFDGESDDAIAGGSAVQQRGLAAARASYGDARAVEPVDDLLHRGMQHALVRLRVSQVAAEAVVDLVRVVRLRLGVSGADEGHVTRCDGDVAAQVLVARGEELDDGAHVLALGPNLTRARSSGRHRFTLCARSRDYPASRWNRRFP